MFAIADGLARLIAPVLPVLADEFWRYLPGERETSVHLAEFPPQVELFIDRALLDRWARLLKIRAAVNAELEGLRQAKVIGQPLEAAVTLRASGQAADLLTQYAAELPALFITSDVRVSREAAAPAGAQYAEGDAGAVVIEVARAAGTKCDRCWRRVPSVSMAPGREGTCPRCEEALQALGR
jgi:isoleucyl-tRNA synthetase